MTETMRFTVSLNRWSSALTLSAIQLEIAAARDKEWRRRQPIAFWLILAASAVAFFFFDEYFEYLLYAVGDMVSFGIGFFGAVIFLLLVSIVALWRVIPVLVAGVRCPVSYEVSPAGITARYAGSDMIVPWSGIDFFRVRRRSVLMVAFGATLILPFAALATVGSPDVIARRMNEWHEAAR